MEPNVPLNGPPPSYTTKIYGLYAIPSVINNIMIGIDNYGFVYKWSLDGTF